MDHSDAKPRQRAIIYANATRRRRRHDASSTSDLARDGMAQASSPHHRRVVSTAAASALSVPSWFDLPLIAADANPIGARVQRGLAKLQLDHDDERAASGDNDRPSHSSYQVPKISQLSQTKDVLRHKLQSRTAASISSTPATDLQYFNGKTRLHKKRRTTHAGAAVVLDRIDRKSRLREKIWRDLNRFGLWYLADEASDGAGDSVDKTVDAIMQQWESANPIAIASRGLSRSDSSSSGKSTAMSSKAMSVTEHRTPDAITKESMDQSDSRASHAVFLTALPPEGAAPAPSDVSVGDSESHVGDDVPEDNDEDEDEDEDDEESDAQGTSHGAPRLIRTPGMKRRARLKELHGFVEKQLQKRLYKSWDTIELAFTGTGDLTTAQIVKFLQHSDVQLSASDAAKVQAILQSHTRDRQASGDADGTDDEASEDTSSKACASAAGAPLVSYNAFRRLFHTTDAQEAAKWKREFVREKTRERQEKAIYERELAALEEKVKKRLAESARHMVDVLAQFRVDPLALPWENEAQRLALRAQLFETIFTKPQRRQLIVSTAAAAVSLGADTTATSVIPSKLSTKVVEAALLQKYSRNGHFDAIEVPDAAYIFHDFAADCIKSSVQRYWAQCAADAWPERQRIFAFRRMKQVFYEWRRFTKHAETLRRYILRKFVAWQHWTAKLHAHYAFVRTTFWPFYTWKRHLQQMIIARGKSAFLANIVRTYIQLRHFRALKTRYQTRRWISRHTARLQAKRARKVLEMVWGDWTLRVQSRIVIHRLWKSRGHALQRLHKLYMVKVTFTLWRYYALLQNDMRRRQHKCLLEQFSRTRSGGAHHHPRHPHHYRPHAGSSTRASTVLPSHGDLDADATPAGAGDSDEEPSTQASSSSSSSTVPALSRIMETSLGQHIKRKSRLYDLCLALYLACREKDRRTMVGNVVTFRRIARALLAQLKARVVSAKKNRFATDLGAFRVLHERFRQWRGRTLYEQQRRTTGETGAADLADETGDKSDLSDDTDDDTADHRTVDSLGRVKLHWRRDRAWRQHAIVHNPVRAQALVQDLHMVFESDARRSDEIHARERELKRKQQAEDAFLRKEAGATLKVKAAQLQQAQQILRTRAHRMHDVLDRVFDDLIAQRTRQQLRSSFRSLRVVVMLKLTTTLCHRAQLRNWLRLCVRFAYWDRHVSELYRMRVKFHAFQSLLKHAVWKWQFESPGLSRALQQRRGLATKYEAYLGNHGLLDGSDASARLALTKYSPANAVRGLFLRWVQFTQFAYAARQIVALARHKRALAQLQSVFVALQHHVKSKYTLESRQHARPFLLRQAEVDLDAYHCKLLALRARLPTTLLRQALARKRQRLLRVAAGSPTLKQLFDEHKREVERRLSLERRLMFSAYAERKVHHYTERSSPLYGTPVGRAFAYEPAPPYGSISDIAVLCSKQVDGLSLVVKAPASGMHEGALHGNPFGTREVFALVKGEVLVSIEGFASQTLYGLRFGTSAGRVSKWFGQCDKGTKFEIRSDFSGAREEIVGVFGFADATSLHALGAVLRRTTVRNIFEGLWLQPDTVRSIDDVALCDRQFAYFLQVRTCDVLAAVVRAHRFALRAYRATHQPPALLRMRVVMALARWLFNALAHGLVHCTAREADGKRMLEHGMATRASGEKLLQDGLHALAVVDSFRDDEQQLSVATLGVKKIAELREMMEQAQQRIAAAKLQIADGDAEVLAAQRILPHLPMTKRMMTAIRRMYRVVQTKDYIDQMDPDVRAILLVGDSASGPTSSASDFATPAAASAASMPV